MSEKQEEKSKSKDDENDDDDLPKPQSTKKDQTEEEEEEKEGERSLEEIEKELDELRPKPPSPRTKRRIEEEEERKDEELKEGNVHKKSRLPIETKSNNEDNNQTHKENELTPGQPDPTVNDNVKIPVLNDRGDVELKPQQGSASHKNKTDNQPTEENKDEKQ